MITRRSCFPVICLFLAAFFACGPVTATPAEVPGGPSRIDRLIERAEGLADRIQSDGLSQCRQDVRALCGECREMGGGFFPGTRALAEAPDKQATIERLSNLAANLHAAAALAPAETSSGPDTISSGQARDRLEEIFASGKYDLVPRKPPWAALIMRKISRWIEKIMNWFGQSGGAVRFFSQIYLLVILTIVLMILAVFITRLVLERLRPRKRASTPSGPSFGRLFDSPGEHRKKAAACIERGDFRGAFRQVFLALLSEIEQAKLAAYDRSLTNREYVREFSGRSKDREATRELTAIVRRYNRKCYSAERCTLDDVNAFDGETGAFLERIQGFSAGTD
ncbi:MAG: hypothetical protein J7M19_04680 [Planctomycetes bacterium]|nr:hypothetical protein [Planctomycetota bacterium]